MESTVGRRSEEFALKTFALVCCALLLGVFGMGLYYLLLSLRLLFEVVEQSARLSGGLP